MHVPEFRKVVDGENSYGKVKDLIDPAEQQNEVKERERERERQDDIKLATQVRLSLTGNLAMKKRFDLNNEKFLRSAVIRFVAENLELRNKHIDDPGTSRSTVHHHRQQQQQQQQQQQLLLSANRKEKDCTTACTVS